MGVPSKGAGNGSPRPDFSISIENVEAKPKSKTCLHCRKRPAAGLPRFDTPMFPPLFCSERCAVYFAQDIARALEFEWCEFCGDWTDQNGYCPSCDPVYVPTFDELADEIMADEQARKAVGYGT